MKLLIVIPALDEEKSIRQIIERCLDARTVITSSTNVTNVEVTVVSDGSTDRTLEIASEYCDSIDVVAFESNRGYGAAIKYAWSRSDADILGFLDADGTCDPRFFRELCVAMEKQSSDIVLGCRINKQSMMPITRRIGNKLFAVLLSAMASKRVSDTASGMRIVRRDSLRKIYPLPDGLHFTPAMSAKAMLSGEIKISEIDMPYHEREGRSKLSVVRDGIRFLSVILSTAFMFRPLRPLGLVGCFFGMVGAALMIEPLIHYVKNGTVSEWMIYRFVVSQLAITGAILLITSGYLASRIGSIVWLRKKGRGATKYIYDNISNWRVIGSVSVILVFLSIWLILPSAMQLAKTGSTYEHWSRFIVMSQLVIISLVLLVTRTIDNFLDLMYNRLREHDKWESNDE